MSVEMIHERLAAYACQSTPAASYDMPVLDYPFPAAVRIFDLASLFAGKLHALMCRNYLKGRDWYDFIWYTARRTPVNRLLVSRQAQNDRNAQILVQSHRVLCTWHCTFS